METFGQRLRHLRKELRLTQVELGQVVGISGGGIAKAESDSSKLTEASIRLICSKYNVSYAWLTEGVGEMWTPKDLEDIMDSYTVGWPEFARAIMRSFVRLPDEDWQQVIELVERVKNEGLSQ
jgi:transcriptional regulator with XRE-family HTH domain